jgi:hypothetical protein
MRYLRIALLLLLILPQRGGAQGPSESRFAPPYVAADRTVSTLGLWDSTDIVAPLRVYPVSGGVEGTLVFDTSGPCYGPYGVRHRLRNDTLVVTIVELAGAICPGIVTQEGFRFHVARLRAGHYQVQVWAEQVSSAQEVLGANLQYDGALEVP